MGITERKERFKESIKAKILNAAKELFVKKGFSETSIRNIAEKIEYSPTTIYLYYKDKNAIFHDIHDEGFGLLGDYMKVLYNVSDPIERLKAMGRVYVKFALDNRELYELMFMIEDPEVIWFNSPDEKWEKGQNAYVILLDTVMECKNQGLFRDYSTDNLTYIFWSAVHGMASLYIKGRSDKIFTREKAGSILNDCVEIFINIVDQIKK
jgi:AcrR family transcriptional regulator